MKNNKLILLFLSLCGGAVGVSYFNKPVALKKPNHYVRKAIMVPDNVMQEQVKTAALKAITPGERGASPEASKVDPQFVHWFAMEAQRIEAREISSLATEKELKRRASKFQIREVNYLASRSASALVPASERILASYLLGLSAEKSAALLVDVASRAPVNPGPHEPHSIDEAKATHERTYKIMAVDAIFNSQNEVSQKIDKLQAIVNQSPDTTIKKYAAGKVDELTGAY